MSQCGILEMKLGNYKEPEIVVIKQGLNGNFQK